MIFYATDDERLAIVIGQDAAEVMVQFFAQRLIAEIWAAVFGRESGVKQNLCERLWHGTKMRKSDLGYNSFRVDDVSDNLPGVARASQRRAA